MASSFLRKLVSRVKSSRQILKPRTQWIRLNIENLDARILPSVTATLKKGGVLSVVADTSNGTTQVEIIQAQNQLTVEDTGTVVNSFDAGQIPQIDFKYRGLPHQHTNLDLNIPVFDLNIPIAQGQMTLTGFPVSEADLDLGDSSLTATVNATLPDGTALSLAGAVNADGTFDLAGSAPNIQVGNFPLPTASFDLSDQAMMVAADVTVGSDSVSLQGSLDSAGNYDLTGTAAITVASFNLNANFELTNASLSVSTDLAIPNVSTVHFAGAVDNQGNFSLSGSATVTVGSFSFSPAFTLTNTSLGVAADVTVPAVGTLHFDGTADSQGNFSLTTSANVTIAVFSLDATFTLANSNQFGGGIGISAASATLTLGSLTATATTVTGQFDFTTTKFALAVGQMSLVLPGVLQAGAANLSVNYDPHAAPGQVLVALASATATITPLNGATITVTGLSIRDNGFAIAGGSGSLASFQLNGFLDIQQPAVSLPSISYTVGQSLTFGGLLTVSASQATLFPGKTYMASFTNVSGGYDFTTGAFALTVGQFTLQIGNVLQAAASGIAVHYRPGQPLTDPVLTIASGSITLPRFNIQGQIQSLVVTQQGFKFGDLSITKTDTIHFGNLADFTGLKIDITNFGVDYSSGISFTGAITVSTAQAVLLPGKAVTGSATNIAGRFDFSQPDKPTFSFHADTVSVTLGSVLTLGATGIDFNTDPGPGQYIAQFGSLTAQLAFLGITGQGRNFAIDASGSFVTLPGFGVSLSTTTDPGALKWPSWLPIQISRLDVQWPNFSQNPLNFTIILSAAVHAAVPGTSVRFDGSVTNFVIDVGLLQQGKFPVTGFDSVAIQVGGTLFGNTVSAGLFVSILRLDAQGNAIPDNDTTTPVVKRVLYGGFYGTVSIMGIGFGIRLGLSELGPLQGYLRLDAPVVLDPVATGLAITGFRAGISFNRTLPTITDARDLGTLADFKPSSDLTLDQWETLLRQSVVNQEKNVQNCMQDGSCSAFSALQGNVTLEGGATLYSVFASSAFQANGDILFSTDGKFFLKGDMTFGGSLNVAGAMFLDVAQAVHGHVSLLWLAQVPETPSILTLYGGVTLMVQAPTVTLTVNGGIDITAFGLAGLSVTGTAVFTVSYSTQVLDLDVTGKMSLDPLGDLVNVGGKLHLQFNPTTHVPEYWGAFAMQPGDLNQLRDLGLTLSGTAAFRFNSTSVQHTQDLVIAGQTQTFVLPPASVSVQVIGTAGFKLGGQDWFSLDGGLAISFRAVLDSHGNPVFRDVVEPDGTHLHIPVLILDVLVDAKLSIGPAGKQARFTTLGYLRISTADGIAAKIVVAFDPQDSQGLASLGVAIDGTFSIALNSSATALTYDIPAGFPDFQGSRHLTVAAGPSLQVYGSGHFIVQQKYILTGQFTLLVTPTQLTGNFTATLALDPLGTLNAQGSLRIASDGALGTLTLTAGGDGALHGTGFKFTGVFGLQVNTTGVTQQGIPPGVQVAATGDLVAGANNDFDLHGSFTLTVASGNLSVGVTATVSVFGQGLPITGTAAILSGTHSGLVLDVFFNLTNFAVGIFTINASTELAVNTTDQPQPGARGNTLAARTAAIQSGDAAHHATVTALGATLDGTLSIGFQNGSLVLNVPSLQLGLFGVTAAFTGFYQSSTNWSLTADGAIKPAGITLASAHLAFTTTQITVSAGLDLLGGHAAFQGYWKSASNWGLDAYANLSVAGFTLTSAHLVFTSSQLTVSDAVSVPYVGTVAMSGSIASNLTITLSFSGSFSIYGFAGTGSLTLTNNGMQAHLDTSFFGTTAGFNGSYQGGAWSLSANASLNVAGFTLANAHLVLTNSQITVSDAMSVPYVGTVAMSGSIASNLSIALSWSGSFSIAGFGGTGWLFLTNGGMQAHLDVGFSIMGAGVHLDGSIYSNGLSLTGSAAATLYVPVVDINMTANLGFHLGTDGLRTTASAAVAWSLFSGAIYVSGAVSFSFYVGTSGQFSTNGTVSLDLKVLGVDWGTQSYGFSLSTHDLSVNLGLPWPFNTVSIDIHF